MEWLDPRADDDARPVQRPHLDGARVSRSGPAMKLGDVGEDRLLEQLLPRLPVNSRVVLGAGDDCAIVDSGRRGFLGLLKTDCLVEEIHFSSRTEPRRVGWKAMARPLSDFAAMSGVPQFALVTVIVPACKSVDWVKRLYQ